MSEELYPRISKVPTDWKYYCECGHEIHPWEFNYCAHCGKKLNWSAENIFINCPFLESGEKCNGNIRNE